MKTSLTGHNYVMESFEILDFSCISFQFVFCCGKIGFNRSIIDFRDFWNFFSSTVAHGIFNNPRKELDALYTLNRQCRIPKVLETLLSLVEFFLDLFMSIWCTTTINSIGLVDFFEIFYVTGEQALSIVNEI